MADYNVLRLLDLPVEILSTIFSMVCSADRVNLSNVCQRFNLVLQRRELNRSVDFQRAYELDVTKMYSFLKDKARCNFITSVNLTSCYWLSSTTIRQCLIRLKQLETMLVADTKLTRSDLKTLLIALPKVKNLAISWNGPVDIGSRNEDLQSIYIYVSALKTAPTEKMCEFLLSCKRIEKITIVTSPLLISEPSLPYNMRRYEVLLPHLQSVLLYMRKRGYDSTLPCTTEMSRLILRNFLLSATSPLSAWESVWIPSPVNHKQLSSSGTIGDPRLMYLKKNLENNGPIIDRAGIAHSPCDQEDVFLLDDSMFQSLLKLRSLCVSCSHKDMDVAISSMFREGCQLQELNIYGNCDKIVLSLCKEMPVSLSSERLRKLCIPASAIWRRKTPQPTSSNACFQGLGKRPRVSHLTSNKTSEQSPFLNLVQSCPNIEDFVMDNFKVRFCWKRLPYDFEWDSQQLIHIANWKRLRKLTLGGIPISSFMFLDRIGRCCQMLTSLTLNYMHLTSSAVGMSGLVNALPLFTKLEDLAIRQSNERSVLHALHQKSLRRVLLVCDKVSGSECAQFLANCTKVVFLYISCDITKTEIRRIKPYILERFAQRQALVFHIVTIGCQGLLREGTETEAVNSVPGIHENEMLVRETTIGGPLPGDYFIRCE